MNDREVVRSLALARVAVGIVAVLFPGFVGQVWFGDEGRRRPMKALMRAFGVRDLVLGIATLDAVDEQRPVNQLLQLGVACDSVDLVATAMAGPDVPRSRKLLVAVMAGGAAATGIRLASNVD